jgi:ribosome maturation factor RimP
MDILHDKLQSLIAPVLQNFNVDFVALELKGSRHNLIVRVIADQEGGITLETCAAISRALSEAFEVTDPIPGRYRLEVSSPGVDRPLKTARDFQRNIGRRVNLHYKLGEGTESIEGTIQEVSKAEVVVATDSGARSIPLSSIATAKLKLKW